MKNIFVLGYGGHAAVVKEACESVGYIVSGFLAEEGVQSTGPSPNGLLIRVRREERLTSLQLGVSRIALGIGNNEVRLWWSNKLIEEGFELPSIVHPRSCVSPSAILKEGVFIGAGAVLQAGCEISKAVLINTNATVEHHVILNDGCHVGPGAVLAGLVKIGSLSFIGAGAVVKDRVEIGQQVVVGVGAAVISNIPDGAIVGGVPARSLK